MSFGPLEFGIHFLFVSQFLNLLQNLDTVSFIFYLEKCFKKVLMKSFFVKEHDSVDESALKHLLVLEGILSLEQAMDEVLSLLNCELRQLLSQTLATCS